MTEKKKHKNNNNNNDDVPGVLAENSAVVERSNGDFWHHVRELHHDGR
jgi:hypothetical protein